MAAPIYPPLPHHLATRAEEHPHKAALIEGDDILDYRTLDLRLRQGVAALHAAGLVPGNRIVVVARRKIELMTAVLAAMGAGAAVLPLSAQEEDIQQVCDYFRPHLLLFSGDRESAPDFGPPVVPIADFEQTDPMDSVPLAAQHIGLVILTSGTTQGIRRGALLSHHALGATAGYMNARMGLDETVRDLVAAPLEHGFGMGRVRCALHMGGTAVLPPGLLTPQTVASELLDKDCNMLSAAVSAMTLLIEDAKPALSAAREHLKWIELGTGHLPHLHRQWLLETFPHTRCFVSYGLTEAIRSTFLELNAVPDDKIDTVGHPAPGISLRLVDERQKEVATGQDGIIQVSGANMASGYFDQPEAWAAKRDGSWLTTGDIGRLDAEGYLTYVGRTDDMINVGGLKVAPQEVEEALKDLLPNGHFAIARIPDPQGIEGFVPALFLEAGTAADMTLETLRDHLRDRLPNFKLPRRLYRLEQLPRTVGTAKIRRAALADLALQAEDSALPRPTDILSRLRTLRPGWPALEGQLRLSRKKLAHGLLNSQLLPQSPPELMTLLARLVETAQTESLDLSRAIAGWRPLFPLAPGQTLALALGCLDREATVSLLWHVLDCQGQLLFLPADARGSRAADLGPLHRLSARHVIIDRARLCLWAEAESHLEDSLSYSDQEHVALTGSLPEPALLAHFKERLGVTPDRLGLHRGKWQLTPCRIMDLSEADSADSLWISLRDLAADIFQVAPDQLTRRSQPDTTAGWDSLAFVSLIVELESHFALKLSPRDILSIRTLGDVETLLMIKREAV
ncbi:hypothetical protein JCM17960_29170 [Magnetospira thiophila]